MAGRDERTDDDEPEGTSVGGRVAIGCGLALLVAVLVAGLIGIGLGARDRLAGWGGDDERDPRPSPPDPEAARGEAPQPPTDPGPDPRIEMARRYRPGPYVRIESLVPSGRLLGPSVGGSLPAATGRTMDNPWVVMGATLRPGPLPGPATSAAPSVRHAAGEPAGTPLTVLARTPARMEVEARDARGGTEVLAYLVELDGYPGHFHLPATVQTELGVVQAGGSDGATIHFAIRAPLMTDGRSLQPGQSFEVAARIAAVDAQGHVSAAITRPLRVMAVGAGDVEVTLTMGEPTDLDLYVTDPAGVTIYFGNTSSFSGGHLDLDANAACSRNVGVDNEHIYWAQHRAPAGLYRVHVAHYESCIGGRPVDYRVTVTACGETVVLAGRYDGSSRGERCVSPTAADRSWCQDVVTFDIPTCAAMGT